MRVARLLLLLTVAVVVAAWHAERSIEARVQDRLVREAAERGFGLAIDHTEFSWWRPLRLHGVRMARDGASVTAGSVVVDWRVAGGRDRRAHVRGVAFENVVVDGWGAALRMPSTSWTIESWTGDTLRETLVAREGDGRLRIDLGRQGPQREATVELDRVDLRRVAVTGAATPALRAGVWSGRAAARWSPRGGLSEGRLTIDGLAVGLPGAGPPGDADRARVAWRLHRDGPRTRVDVDGAFGGVDARVEATLVTGEGRPLLEGRLEARVQLARALAAANLELPVLPPGADMGTATLRAAGSLRLGDPQTLDVRPTLEYAPPAPPPAAFEALRAGFRHEPADGITLDVRPGAPDYVAFEQVPALFVRTLVISEDAGFWGHPGIDVAEIPVAWATNAERGRSAFGASTITQQLVKNLFLNREKTYTRKLQEAALALLLDASLPKQRILEIYLNVIEWGPGVYGVGHAARHYFGKAPAELTPKEIAFLVCLVPSPVRYHQAHVLGRTGPGMDRLMGNLLAKVYSVEALDTAAYEAALAEPLVFAPEHGAAPVDAPAEEADEI